MSLSAPQSLDANHRLEEFDCGKPALTDWLLRHARQAQGSGSAKHLSPVMEVALPGTSV